MGENHSNRRRPVSKQQADARREARRAAREAVMALLFETEYHEGEEPAVICERAAEARELDLSDPYIRRTYIGIITHLGAIDAVIGRHATGWRTGRLSRVSRAVLRLGTYELAYGRNIPAPIAINEAVELSKKYDDPKARAFVNGVLNAVKNELEACGGVLAEPEVASVEVPEEVAAKVAELAALDGAEDIGVISAADVVDETADLLAEDGVTEAIYEVDAAVEDADGATDADENH